MKKLYKLCSIVILIGIVLSKLVVQIFAAGGDVVTLDGNKIAIWKQLDNACSIV